MLHEVATLTLRQSMICDRNQHSHEINTPGGEGEGRETRVLKRYPTRVWYLVTWYS